MKTTTTKTTRKAMCFLFVAALSPFLAPAHAQEAEEELTPYSIQEVENFLESFLRSYKKKNIPEDDANSVLADLKKAYRYFEAKGDARTKEEIKAQRDIVKTIMKGLRARKRKRVTLECVRILGEIGDPAAAKAIAQWLEKVLDEKAIIPEWVEYGFKSLAWIGGTDKRSLDLVTKFGTGKHSDESVPAFALEGARQYRFLKGKVRKDIFKTVVGWMQGLHSNARGGDPKKRATYEKRYDAVKIKGLMMLNELATYQYMDQKTAFTDPNQAMTWFRNHKSKKWPNYVGPRFRKTPAKQAEKKKPAG